VKWNGVYSVAIRSKPKKGGRVSPDTEEIPEKVDTGVGGSKNAQALRAAHPEVDMHGGGQSAAKAKSISSEN